jgi:hypothetical protein
LTEDWLLRAVQVACEIADIGDRAHAIAGLGQSLAVQLKGQRLYVFWKEIFPPKQKLSRGDFITVLGALAPVLAVVEGPDAVVEAIHAIEDAARWWP